MKASTIAQTKYRILSVGVLIIIWHLLSNIYSPIIVPNITSVLGALRQIIISSELRLEILLTLKRLATALVLSVTIGGVLGVAAGCNKKLQILIMPIVNMVQSVPPISWLVLALIWFGLNGNASVFITAVSTIPIIMINIMEGIKNVDADLIEMGMMYQFSKKKMITKVVIPSIFPYFEVGLKLAIGSGCKVIVMGEVLSTSNGIGGQLTNARLNIETEYIFAWTIIIVLMFYICNQILKVLLERGRKGERYAYRNTESIQRI